MRLIACILFATCIAQAQPSERFYGKFLGLQADSVHMYERVLKTTPSVKQKFIPPIDSKATIATGKLTDARGSGEIEALLIESHNKPPLLALDINSDSVVTGNERFELTPAPAGHSYYYVIADLPIRNNPLFTAVPMYVRYFRGFKHPKLADTDRLIDQSVMSLAIADVKIGAKAVRFQYPFVPTEPMISTTEGLFGIDVDGDGLIANFQFSIETSYASQEEVVLRYGDMYLSTVSIDLAKNEIVVRRREPAEYLREELSLGEQMPDFTFVDFAGKPRSLKEFRGKYLLIEWWGVWCVDCIRDMPYTVAAYERFKSRGLEILGLNWDDRVEDAVGFLQKSKAAWPQARKDSIKTLTEVTYRIQEYPSSILLDPEGKIVSLNQKSLQGPRLIETLDKLFPR